MKIVATLLLVPVVALAQAPNPGMDRGQVLEQMKRVMLPMMEQSLPEMDKTRQCVQESGNTAELNKCAEIMQEFQKKMMAGMAPPPGADAKMPPPQKAPEIEWSQEKRDEILQGLDISIKQATAMTGCLRSSETPEQMDSCMQKSGLSPKRR